ncbi:MAG: NifB/NifX family molybdenum-iron cluster-binding protein [bacterium]
MKIAIPISEKGRYIADHFSRAEGFMIIVIEDKKVLSKNIVKNPLEYKNDEYERNEQGTCDHNKIIDSFEGAEGIICCRLGRKIFRDLKERGLKIYISEERDLERAIEIFVDGNINQLKEFGSSCNCEDRN